jgi:predicted PurR-regulated permease PerM
VTMAIGNMDLYKALKEAGASEESAIQAAKSIAGPLPQFWALTGTLAILVALTLGLVWAHIQTAERLATLEERFAAFDSRLGAVEQRLDGVEQRLTAFEQRVGQQLDQILQQFELLRRERGGAQP